MQRIDAGETLARRSAQHVARPFHQAQNALLRDDGALRLSGGARCKHDVGRIGAGRGREAVIVGDPVDRREPTLAIIFCKGQRLAEWIGVTGFAEQDFRPQPIDRSRTALRWVVRIEKYIGRSEPQACQQQRIGDAAFGQLQGNHIAMPDAAGGERRRAAQRQIP